MNKKLLKPIVILLIIGLNWTGISAIGQTVAYFNDTEISEENTYTAGILDFSLSGNGFDEDNLETNHSTTTAIEIIDNINGSVDFKYIASSTNIIGNCNSLNLMASLNGIEQYNGSLIGFKSEATTTLGVWEFTATSTGFSGTCDFDIIFKGWQEEIDEFDNSGFWDTEIISNTISSTQGNHLLISKVYYDVCNKTDGTCGEYKGEEGDNEWVEIYNPTASPVNITEWEICDDYICREIPTSNDIPAGGFAIISKSSTTWENYWNVPDDVVKVELGSAIGYGLNDGGDSVILKDNNGYEIDAMSYGSSNYAFDPACPDVAEGHMLGRVPVSQDTNTKDDWQDLSLPKVSNVTMSPLQDEHCGCCGNEGATKSECSTSGGTWHCASGLYYSQKLTINWNASTTNTSGDDALLIDVVYVTDDDCSGDISDEDTEYIIDTGLSNDMNYTWDGWETINEFDNGKRWKDQNKNNVPYFYGYAWIKIIAHGQENFMINNYNISIPVFEPMPPGLSEDQLNLILEDSSCGDCCSELRDNYFNDPDNLAPIPEFDTTPAPDPDKTQTTEETGIEVEETGTETTGTETTEETTKTEETGTETTETEETETETETTETEETETTEETGTETEEAGTETTETEETETIEETGTETEEAGTETTETEETETIEETGTEAEETGTETTGTEETRTETEKTEIETTETEKTETIEETGTEAEETGTETTETKKTTEKITKTEETETEIIDTNLTQD